MTVLDRIRRWLGQPPILERSDDVREGLRRVRRASDMHFAQTCDASRVLFDQIDGDVAAAQKTADLRRMLNTVAERTRS